MLGGGPSGAGHGAMDASDARRQDLPRQRPGAGGLSLRQLHRGLGKCARCECLGRSHGLDCSHEPAPARRRPAGPVPTLSLSTAPHLSPPTPSLAPASGQNESVTAGPQGAAQLRRPVTLWRADHQNVRHTALVHAVLRQVVHLPEKVRVRSNCIHSRLDRRIPMQRVDTSS